MPGLTVQSLVPPRAVNATFCTLVRAPVHAVAYILLLDNAVRYNRPGGKIMLWINDGAPPSVNIENEGPGITDAGLALVFERFYRVRRSAPVRLMKPCRMS
jgi:K+-sensing histidine kinase KdpD